MAIVVFIEGREIDRERVEAWERRRLIAAYRRLAMAIPPGSNLPARRAGLAQAKRSLDYQRLVARLRPALRLSALLSNALARWLGRARACSVVELRVDGVTAEQASRHLDALMLEATPANEIANLAACPDHWALVARGAAGFEVIEATGGSPLPTQFFIAFGDESGLTTARDPSFSHHSTGTARTAAGRVIGGVRHQWRDREGGIDVRLCVEFPAAMPRHFIRQHQWHLACEFSNWFETVLARVREDTATLTRS